MNIERVKADLDLGRRIFESVPLSLRPGWSAGLLKVFSNSVTVPKEIQALLEIVDDKNKWAEAHQQFNNIRMFGLRNKKFQPESYLLLAENVAKVTYNSSGEAAPFDHDAGWWIPALAIQTAEFLKSKESMNQVTRILNAHITED